MLLLGDCAKRRANERKRSQSSMFISRLEAEAIAPVVELMHILGNDSQNFWRKMENMHDAFGHDLCTGVSGSSRAGFKLYSELQISSHDVLYWVECYHCATISR